eukprot:RCo008292
MAATYLSYFPQFSSVQEMAGSPVPWSLPWQPRSAAVDVSTLVEQSSFQEQQMHIYPSARYDAGTSRIEDYSKVYSSTSTDVLFAPSPATPRHSSAPLVELINTSLLPQDILNTTSPPVNVPFVDDPREAQNYGLPLALKHFTGYSATTQPSPRTGTGSRHGAQQQQQGNGKAKAQPLSPRGAEPSAEFETFLRNFPRYDAAKIDALRKKEYGRLDEPDYSTVYLDYTGGSLYAEHAQLEAFTDLLKASVLGNPH